MLLKLLLRILCRFLPDKEGKKLLYRRQCRKLSKSSLGKAMEVNASLKNIHQGKRCFVLGNGPSLSDIDLSLLKDEITFTVNDLYLKEDFGKLNTTYHLFADPYYYDNLEEIIKLLQEKSMPLGIFIEGSGFEKLKQKQLKQLYPLYIFTNGIEVEGLSFIDIDLCRYLPYFCTVVQSALVIAVYMGFQEIYLLGCDCTGILNYIDKQKGISPSHYAYRLSEEEGQKQLEIKISSEHMFFEWYHIFKSYRLLRELFDKKGIKLVNLTQNSILDSLEKGKLEDVIKD